MREVPGGGRRGHAGRRRPRNVLPEELRAGVRLACRCFPVSGSVTVTILPESRPARLSAYSTAGMPRRTGPSSRFTWYPKKGLPLGVALDLGTSTLAGALLDLRTGAVLGRASSDNPQMACGEDLISRIVFGEENPDGFPILRSLLRQGVER